MQHFNRFSKMWSVWVVGVMMWTSTASAATRPVTIGLNANWEHFLARSANVGWVRIDFVWSVTEPQQDVWDFNYTDGRVAEAEQNGLQILAVLHYVPSWANGGGCEATPPLTTTDWAQWVQQLAIRYSGRIAAYEIWNEPDIAPGDCAGIGWNRNVEEPPLYTDFVHAAAQQIRTYSPGSLVVGPAYKSRNDGSGSQADNRKRRFFQQMSAATYPDGPGPSFLDVTSYHNNADSTEPSRDMGRTLNTNNLYYLNYYLYSKRFDPVWVTEYGWRSNAVGDNGQREKECNLTKIYTGLLESAYTGLGNYNVDHSFVYVEKDCGCSRTIYYGNNTPKPVVTQYLHKLAFPAVQQPAYSADYPNCNGSSLLQEPEVRLSEARTDWKTLGLQDPREGLPFGFTALDAESSETSVHLSYKGRDGAMVSVSARPAETDDVQFISDSAAEWNRGDMHLSVSHLAGPDPGRRWARTLAASVDPDFAEACVEDRLATDDVAVRDLGFHVPKAPKGFVALDNRLDLTRLSSGCGSAAVGTTKNIDFVWSFIGASGKIIRAGIYRYGNGFQGNVRNPKSLHWGKANGTRYWAAVDGKDEMTPALEEALHAVARSMDTEYLREPQPRQRQH